MGGDRGRDRDRAGDEAFAKATAVWRAKHHKKVSHRSVCEAVRHWIIVWGQERTQPEGPRAGRLGVYECRWGDDRYEIANQIMRGWRAGYASRSLRGAAGVHWHVGHERDTVDKGLSVQAQRWRRNRG